MALINSVIIAGNVTKDPELRFTPKGSKYVRLRIAVNRKFRTKEQEIKEETCFVTISAWEQQAEFCAKYVRKGSPILIEGRLQQRDWKDEQTGENKSMIEVKAHHVQLLKWESEEKPVESDGL